MDTEKVTKKEIIRENDVMTCKECDGWAFEVVSVLIYKTKLNNPNLQKDAYIPMKTFRCADCKHIPDEYNYFKKQGKII